MSEGSYDETKGRVKEAVGDLTGREDLEREGKADQISGSFKQRATHIVDKVREVGGELVDKVKGAVDRKRS